MAAIPPDRRPAEPTPLHPPLSPPVCFHRSFRTRLGSATRRSRDGPSYRPRGLQGSRKRATGDGGRGGCSAATPAPVPGLISGMIPRDRPRSFDQAPTRGAECCPKDFSPGREATPHGDRSPRTASRSSDRSLVAARMVARFGYARKNQWKYSRRFLCINIKRVHIQSTGYPHFFPRRLEKDYNDAAFYQDLVVRSFSNTKLDAPVFDAAAG